MNIVIQNSKNKTVICPNKSPRKTWYTITLMLILADDVPELLLEKKFTKMFFVERHLDVVFEDLLVVGEKQNL